MDPELHWQIYYGLGKLWEAQGDSEHAYYSYRAAIQLIEEIRRKALVEEFKAGVLQKRFEVYQAMILLLARLERAEEAFQYVERARARNLLDLLGNSKIKSPRPQYRELIEKERALQAKISTLTGQLSLERVPGQGQIRGPAEEIYRNALHQAQREYRLLQVDLKLRNPEYAAMIQSEPLSVSGIQPLLDEESVLLEYFLTRDNTFIFVITQKTLHLLTIPEGMESLRGKIILFRGTAVRQMNKENLAQTSWIAPLRGLYRVLVEPLQQAGYLEGKKHLVIVPQGLLHYLPFQALVAQQNAGSSRPHFLTEDYIISYVPSASMLPFFREKNSGKRDNLLLLAPRIAALPMSEKEVREISGIFGKGAVPHLGPEASESLVKQQGANFDLLHFATTAHFNKINPMFSRVDMARSDSDDGNLEVHEVFNLDLQANMVVLSACKTALGSGYSQVIPKGDDLVSLSRAFLYAGSASVVASLWEISDPSTALFMARFYENLRDQNKAAALAQTQREMISGSLKEDNQNGEYVYSHPYFWASFVLIGDWE
jgi:CHAT domain-containing protein